jgi:hypothetical protein
LDKQGEGVMIVKRSNTDVETPDMLNDAAVIHTVVWDPTESAATRPLLLTVPNPANPEILAEYYTFGFDQAKNVTELFDSSDNIAATYDHGPFGEDMTAAGPAAALNPFRFSSEAWDDTLGLVQYTFRAFLSNRSDLRSYLNIYQESIIGEWTAVVVSQMRCSDTVVEGVDVGHLIKFNGVSEANFH